ncbi:MAG TPA: ABC transporter permease [Rhizomicrobium sp.]|nr:ABC transporter permease [Rhizomicrobium sp.]
MFRNYLVTALRNIARHKLYSFINIAGLAVGLACVIFVLLFIRDELSYDKWIPGTQNLYRVEKTSYIRGRDPFADAMAPFPMPAAMRDEIPEVVAMTRLNYDYRTLFAGNRQFREHVAEVDPNFFNVIKLPLVKGDPVGVFRDPQSVVLSESAARKYFGTTDAIGKTIRTTANCEASDDTEECRRRLVPLKITGIMRDIPHNSQLDGDVFMPNTSIVYPIGQRERSWFAGAFGYVVLAPGVRPETIVSKTTPILDRALPPQPDDNRKGSQRWAIHLTPFTDVHLTSGRWRFNEKPSGSRTTLYGAGIVGTLILLVACFNFMNLSTARALLRAREIALRKTHGARRSHLVVQFLGEAVLMALISLVLALALVELLQPAFARLLQHPVALHYATDWPLLLAIVGIAVAAGLISGSYPALVLSGFRPIAVLRANDAGQAGSARLRTTLVVLQFAVSIGLSISAAVVFSQISFARNMDLGFRKDDLLVIPADGLVTLGGHESFVQRLRSGPGILDVAVTNAIPFGTYGLGLAAAQLPGHSDLVGLNLLAIGTNTAQLLGVRLIAGRLLSDSRAQDQFDTHSDSVTDANEGHNVLIDDTAAASLGFKPQQAVGKTIILGKSHLQIVGVVANVKFGGAREPAMATMYVYDPHDPASVLIRLRPGTEPKALSFVDRAWHAFAPTKAIDRWFMDDVYGRQYRSDERQGKMFAVFVLIAIFIACLGLFGLAAFTAGRRTKEIGIRKVFGARTRDVTLLLLWQFSIPVLVANLIAWPLAWYYLHGWLQGFAYRIPLSPLYFAGAGFAALVIAWATILAHALRVARANPVHALRAE